MYSVGSCKALGIVVRQVDSCSGLVPRLEGTQPPLASSEGYHESIFLTYHSSYGRLSTVAKAGHGVVNTSCYHNTFALNNAAHAHQHQNQHLSLSSRSYVMSSVALASSSTSRQPTSVIWPVPKAIACRRYMRKCTQLLLAADKTRPDMARTRTPTRLLP